MQTDEEGIFCVFCGKAIARSMCLCQLPVNQALQGCLTDEEKANGVVASDINLINKGS